MARTLPTGRVTDLEQQMHAIGRRLDGLDTQISQFREEMHVAVAATNARVDNLRVEVLTALATTKAELQQSDETVRREMHALREESLTALAATRAQIEQGDEDTRRYMHVLHEEVIERLKWIQEG